MIHSNLYIEVKEHLLCRGNTYIYYMYKKTRRLINVTHNSVLIYSLTNIQIYIYVYISVKNKYIDKL